MITNSQVKACVSALKVEKLKKKNQWVNEIENDIILMKYWFIRREERIYTWWKRIYESIEIESEKKGGRK